MFNKIAKYRKRSKLTQEELATKLDISQSTLSSWESGKLTPSMEYIDKLALIFGCSPFDLFQRGKFYQETRAFSDVDIEEILQYFKEIDELINVTRYMTEDERFKLLSIAKAAFPERFDEAKSEEHHYKPNRKK